MDHISHTNKTRMRFTEAGFEVLDEVEAAPPPATRYQIGDRVLVAGQVGVWKVAAVALITGGERPPHLEGVSVLYAVQQDDWVLVRPEQGIDPAPFVGRKEARS